MRRTSDADGAAGFALVVCAGPQLMGSVGVPGPPPALWGQADLDEDGRDEVLLEQTRDGTVTVLAATVALRGLQLTDLAAARHADDPDTAGFNGQLVASAYRVGVGHVAVGSASVGEHPEIDYPVERPTVWSSPDGEVWERRPLPGGYRLRGVSAAVDGFVAFGVSDLEGAPTSDAVVVVSDDGVRWD